MSLYATSGEVEHRTYLYLRLRDPEGPLDLPQVMVCGMDIVGRDVRVGKVSLQPVPSRIGFKLVIIDGHLDVALQPQEPVIAPLVYVVLRQGAAPVGLLQTAHPLLPVMGILAGALVGISHQQASSVALVVLDHPSVDLRLPKYPVLYLPALVPDLGSYDVPVAVRLKVRYVVPVHQPRVGNHDEVLRLIFPDELRHHRQHRVPLVLVPLVYAVGQRIASDADEKPEDDLGVPVAPLLGEARPAQIILVVRLEIEGRHIVEQDADMPA